MSTFVVTGGTSGLGLATVLLLTEKGFHVANWDRDAPESQLPCTRFEKVDVTCTNDIAKALQKTITWSQETGKTLRGVVNCAGIGFAQLTVDRYGKAHEMDLFNKVIEINLSGTFDVIRQVCAYLCKVEPRTDDGERGVVVCVASSSAFDAQQGQAAYAASKGAIASMTLPLSRDLSRFGIRVVTVAPSLFETSMAAGMSEKTRKSLARVLEFPARFGKGQEFAHLVGAILENTYLNGTVIRLDGATRMSKM